jgi:hypothetical protein
MMAPQTHCISSIQPDGTRSARQKREEFLAIDSQLSGLPGCLFSPQDPRLLAPAIAT